MSVAGQLFGDFPNEHMQIEFGERESVCVLSL